MSVTFGLFDWVDWRKVPLGRLYEERLTLLGGRLELGIGRGVSPYEVGYHGLDPARTRPMFQEALAVLVAGMTSATGVVWAVAYWNDWYVKAAERFYPRLGLRAPTRGVGEGLWDKLWLNRERQPWLTVYMKDGRI